MRGGSVFSKKGSMQMSIEAIIILVIAMVLLGLGLTFVKGLFGQGTDALLGKFEPIQEYCDVGKEQPILPKTYTLSAGKADESASICVYNNVGQSVSDGLLEVIECLTPAGAKVTLKTDAASGEPIQEDVDGTLMHVDTDGNPFPITLLSLGEDIGRNQQVGYKVAVNTGGASVGTYRCKLQVRDAADTTGSTKIGPVQAVFNME